MVVTAPNRIKTIGGVSLLMRGGGGGGGIVFAYMFYISYIYVTYI